VISGYFDNAHRGLQRQQQGERAPSGAAAFNKHVRASVGGQKRFFPFSAYGAAATECAISFQGVVKNKLAVFDTQKGGERLKFLDDQGVSWKPSWNVVKLRECLLAKLFEPLPLLEQRLCETALGSLPGDKAKCQLVYQDSNSYQAVYAGEG
ncbi:unnamed protein product, partial [Symbiodinium sp. KB8]